MALSATLVQPQTEAPVHQPHQDIAPSMLSALLLTVYAAQKSKKNLRKLKRQFLWTALKLKLKSFLTGKAVSDRVLIYILLGVVALILVFYAPLVALILALVVLILILAGVL